ncbi:MAG TPA: hypothetical protein VJ808_03005 [Gemmatimonadales bacterium]|nr:hypothetical protein [Gemmatimonadales bacterium]
MSVSPGLNRRGATLPLTILLLSLMGVAVAISFRRVSSERRITGDSRAQLGAFAVAQSGLNRFLSTINGKPAGPYPVTVTYNDLPGGTAQVDLRQLRESTMTLLPAVYIITSRGTYTASKNYDAIAPAAQRTVATYAQWVPTPFDLNGAFTSLNQVEINGNSYSVSGTDRATASATCPGPQAAIPGLATPNGDVSEIDFPANLSGNPATSDIGTPGGAGTAKDEVDIDWAAILAGTAFPADYVSPTWPTATQFNNWPVTRVNGDLTLPSGGKGILVVTGNLTWNGTPLKTWEGLILVGGVLTANGQGNIYGALVTGLNIKVGTPVGLGDLGNGTKDFRYDSCALARALGHIGSIQRLRNAWSDTWPSY